MMSIENPQILPKKAEQLNEIGNNNVSKAEVIIDMDKIALKIVEDFSDYFPNHEIIYKGEQSFPDVSIDSLYFFNVMTKSSTVRRATFSVQKLDMQLVGAAFVKTMKNFGESVKNVKEYDEHDK